MESDCEQLVKLIHKKEDWPSLAVEIDEINAIFNTFDYVSLSFIPRSQNFRADSLAKGSRSREISPGHVNVFAPSWLANQAGLVVAN